MKTSSEFDTDVVVVGSGPMGGTTALALATYGVRVHVVSKWNWVANTPRAHIINQRAVEVLRDLGVEEATKLEATPWELMGDTLFTTSLGGPEVARLQTWGTGDDRRGDYLQGSPCTMLDVPQPLMEPVLITNAAKRGAKVSFNTEYLSHTQDADGVTVTCTTGSRTPPSPSAPGSWSAPTAPARRSPRTSAWRSPVNWPGPAPSTPGSTPTCPSTSRTGRASCTGS